MRNLKYLMEKKSMKQRTVSASESNIANENKYFVKVTAVAVQRKQCKDFKVCFDGKHS